MKLLGVGIDLISIPRVKVFLETHSAPRAARLLSPQEKKRFARKKTSARTFARIFSAKEAFFKTLGESWMGAEGFSFMETSFLSQDRFAIKTLPGFFRQEARAEGCFFSAGKLLGAQVLRWEKSGGEKS